MAQWWVYILQCGDQSLYTGITTDLKRRLAEHQQGGLKAAKYLRGRHPLTLVFTQALASRSQALRLELKIKALSREDKLCLVRQEIFWDGHGFVSAQDFVHNS